jgi:fibronectin type 3 domain-containing protein
VNDTGTVVGYSLVDEWTTIPFVWDAQNEMRDLNTLLSTITPNTYPGSLTGGVEINGAGQILATTVQGFCLLTPSSQPPGPELPAAPSSISSDASERAVQIYWNSVYYASGYNVKRATVSGGPYTTIARGVTDTTFLDTAVVNGARYYYVVSSVNGSYESADSPETAAQLTAPPPPPPVPNAPTDLTATVAKGAKTVNLAWKQPTNTEIHWNRVYRSTNGGASYTQLALINAGPSYIDGAVSRGVTYVYAVTAINSNGQESVGSNTVTVRVK